MGITSYYCVILKMMILHDAIKTIKSKVFPFSLKKEQNLVSFSKKQKTGFSEKKTKNRWVFFWKNPGFSQPWAVSLFRCPTFQELQKSGGTWISYCCCMWNMKNDLSWFVIRFPLCGVIVTGWYWLIDKVIDPITPFWSVVFAVRLSLIDNSLKVERPARRKKSVTHCMLLNKTNFWKWVKSHNDFSIYLNSDGVVEYVWSCQALS